MNVTVLDKDIKAVKNAGGIHRVAYKTKRPDKNFDITVADVLVISEDKLPELVALIYRVRPQVVRDIVCEECPEHLGTYHTNEIERGHKHH